MIKYVFLEKLYLFTNIELVNVLISAYRAINYLWNVEKNRLIDAKKEGYSPKKMSISSLYIKISVKTFFICISLGYTKEKETERGVDRKSGHSDLISLLTPHHHHHLCCHSELSPWQPRYELSHLWHILWSATNLSPHLWPNFHAQMIAHMWHIPYAHSVSYRSVCLCTATSFQLRISRMSFLAELQRL